ncbi:hypothetical protein [Clostridium perfringens]|uniref:hypothetical protein n=1 Tax=Clostridium perfringens TaxID=1502 RepID=UPI0018993C3C|nr:hypothetical protein [Clostridium perfringens]MDM0607485.1 hypothetical protein [Clostridium perfringens]MDM0625684.1 hypothetical protein [Clostridium perfringens]WEV17797.1 hypothetical protein PL323_09100 [Clostridium perfringens D]
MTLKNKNNLIKHLSFITIILISFILIFTFKDNSTKSVINENTIKETIKSDLNGDGKEDCLYIELGSENNYIINATINEKSYELTPNKTINSLGNFSPNRPITLNLLDLDRNNIKEIIVQSSEEDSSIQHLFKWTGNGFEDIFYSTNNILGIVDSNNGKTPKILSFSLGDSKENIQKYMLLNKKLKNISYDTVEPTGLYSIISFIDIISLNYEISELPNIFATYISKEDLSQIWRLEKESYYYDFQDAFFMDIAWNNTGEATNCSWTLNFNKIPKENPNNKSQVKFIIQLEKINDTFLISSINLNINK